MYQGKRIGQAFDIRLERMWESVLSNHPYLSFLVLLAVMPMLILAAILISTVLILFPVSMLFGWL
jgi:hypothetical protein